MCAARADRGLALSRQVRDRDEERRWLARELHDGPAQSLAAALFGVDLALASLDSRPGVAREELVHAREQVRDAIEDLRGLMAGLRPRLLEERGLIVALQSLASAPDLWGPRIEIETGGFMSSTRSKSMLRWVASSTAI